MERPSLPQPAPGEDIECVPWFLRSQTSVHVLVCKTALENDRKAEELSMLFEVCPSLSFSACSSYFFLLGCLSRYFLYQPELVLLPKPLALL